MSIQPVTKAAEHNYLINSILVLEKEKRKKEAVKAYLIKNSKGEEGGTLTSSRRTG